MTPFGLSGLLAGVFSLGFGVLVFVKSENKKLGRLWALFSISAAGWGFGAFLISRSFTPETALYAFRIAYATGVIWIAPLFYHFISVFCEIHRPRVVSLHYLLTAFFLCLIPTRFFFYAPVELFPHLYFPASGLFFPFFFIYWISSVAFSHFELIRSLRVVTSAKRKQIQYFFLATAIGFTGGSLCYFPMFGIHLYPWGNFSVSLYPIIMTYAILRYNLMDIRIFIRRAALLVFVYAALVSLVLLFLFATHQTGIYASSRYWRDVLTTALILSVGPFIYAFVIRRNLFFNEHTLAGLTHELKSPLAAIESAIVLLKDFSADPEIGAARSPEYIDIIVRNAERLRGNVTSLLSALGGDSRSSLRLQRTDLVALLNDIAEAHRPEAQAKGVALNVDADGGDVSLLLDSDRMRQVVANLIGNAIKFSPEGTIDIRLRRAKETVSVQVSDKGLGIPSDELPHVFDRLFQGKHGRGRKGSGLGLAIAKAWVEAHGGKIWAESEGEGKGTTVTFTVPVG